jgi:AcrR family transcriptional regulator
MVRLFHEIAVSSREYGIIGDVSTLYEQHGRTRQKERTRRALVDAARALVAQGVSPTVEDAAEAAEISRATAYRYFANQAALLAAAHPETGTTSLLPPDPPDDPAQRVALVVEAFTKLIVETEPQQRTMLRLSLEGDPTERPSLPLRQGRAIGWLTEALEPARPLLGDDGIRRTALAVRSVIGIEALVWLTDIGKLSRRRAVEIMRSNAEAICRAALADAGG